MKVFETLDVVFDMSGVCDPTKDWYDHHQKVFYQYSKHGFIIKLSIFGLMYMHYRRKIVYMYLGLDVKHSKVVESIFHYTNISWEILMR